MLEDYKEASMFKRRVLSMVLLVGMLFGGSVPHALAATNCDQAQLVADLTVPDGAAFAPGAQFTKTWRFMNNGSCAWTKSYSIIFVGGDMMGAPSFGEVCLWVFRLGKWSIFP